MIKNIIFDFGDIFINLDKQATINELGKMGVTEFSDKTILLYHNYEKGLISTKEFISYFHEKFNLNPNQLIKSWNAVLLDFPTERLRFLKELAATKKYRLFLLSNTNELHIDWVKKSVGLDFFEQFKSCFEKFYLSHEIHFRKPDLEIYEFVLTENNLIPENTLFVDDLEENTEAAKKLGIKVWNLDPKTEDVSELYEKNLPL